MVETMSVASFVSVHGDKSHNTRPTSFEAVVSESWGNASKESYIQVNLRSPKVKRSILKDYLLDQTVPIVVRHKVSNQSSEMAATEARIGV